MSDPQVGGYSWRLGLVYVFNLLVGAALLALPKAFAETGWLLGLAFLVILAFISYLTVTFTVEAMAITNALLVHKSRLKKQKNVLKHTGHDYVVENNHTDEAVDSGNPTVQYRRTDDSIAISGCEKEYDLEKEGDTSQMFRINVNVDMGEMSRMLFHKGFAFIYYISICLYLYGGLSIYAAAVAKSLTTIVCDDSTCFDNNVTSPCRRFTRFSVADTYRISLATFTLLICPFTYFNISQTKLLQLFTTLYRWMSMLTMIVLSVLQIFHNIRQKQLVVPKTAVVENLPRFFGVALYAFMCQHSIPEVLTPVRKNKRLHLLVVIDFIAVILFYALVLISAVFAFPVHNLQDLYTLNFTHPIYLKYMLQFFPILTLSANFPILSIVLRQNLKNLFLRDTTKDYGVFLGRILFPSIVVLPPICVAYFTFDISMLVSYTGTYAGAVIQYVVPTMLVYFGRRKMRKLYGDYNNPLQSPFKHQVWVSVVMFWYLISLGFVVYSKFHKHAFVQRH